MKIKHIISKVAATVEEIFEKDLPNGFFFHNINHTEEVVKASLEIGMEVKLTEDELEVVQIASWFHDVGYCHRYYGHEDLSLEIAERTLTTFNYNTNKLKQVLTCIASTKYPQKPYTLIEKVICDADLYHLSKPNYYLYEQRLRREWKDRLGKNFSDREWIDTNCQLLQKHKYFTIYGQAVLQPSKETNIEVYKCRSAI